jgi:hypothetical protein
MEADLVAERASDVLRDEAQLVDARAQCRCHPDRADAGHLMVAVQRPLPGAAVVLAEHARALERCRREAVEMQALDLHDVVGLGDRALVVAPVEDARPDDVRAGVLVEDRLVAQRVLRGRQCGQRLVLDLHQLGSVACQLARRCDDRDDRLAHVAHPSHREGIVLDVGARLDRELEERVGQDRNLVAGERAVDTAQLERLRDVDRHDLRVRVRRADEVHVAHAVTLDVVEEDALALDEALVLLARDVRAGEARLRLAGCHDERPGLCLGLRHCFTALIASTMLT